jgi:hypothetical protein
LKKVYDGHTNKNSTKSTRNSRKQKYSFEMGNIKTTLSHAADKSLGKYKEFTQKKILTTWDYETTLIVQKIYHTRNIFKDHTKIRLNIKAEGQMPKEKSEKDIANFGNNFSHT